MAVSHAPRLAGAVWLSLFATRQLFGCGVGIFKSIERRWPCGSSPPPSFANGHFFLVSDWLVHSLILPESPQADG